MRRAIALLPAALGIAGALTPSSLPELGHRHPNVSTNELGIAVVAERVSEPQEEGAPYGNPVSQQENVQWRLLQRKGFLIAYDENRRNPAWVTYSYTFSPQTHSGHTRFGSFYTDRDTVAQVSDGDYDKTGYSRGHMAPSFGIFTYFGRDAQKQAYYMSNIVPQQQPMNAGPWEEAEDRTANSYTAEFGRVWTIDGPVYSKNPKTISAKKIHVPDYTFKIVVRYDEESQQPRVMAFLMPQSAKQKDAAAEYIASVDEIEERTGLDFLSELPDELEEALEGRREPHLWP